MIDLDLDNELFLNDDLEIDYIIIIYFDDDDDEFLIFYFFFLNIKFDSEFDLEVKLLLDKDIRFVRKEIFYLLFCFL